MSDKNLRDEFAIAAMSLPHCTEVMKIGSTKIP